MKQNKKSPIFKHTKKNMFIKIKKRMTLECVFSMKRDSIIYLLPKMRCGMDFFHIDGTSGWQ